MFAEDLISQSVIPEWYKFGLQLGFDYGQLDTIAENATQKANEDCAVTMLKQWRKGKNATTANLIGALRAIKQNRFALQLEKG